ncbi:RagB/SusD family nutrient uptake outer membrane protein [Confluentibacter sediminis]|uniref:RagB/SusD family nutrient uptake outer membrane protein n=1 Tax=Confluentibacter sediminis TaxID=2219045 RepID=UPI000DAC4B5C|nr:RagB/SusD family nutrient uptake outer membrane protein [Confluentibacter sediminis]
MKTTNKIILSFFSLCTILVIVSACSEKDLELADPGKLSPDNFYSTEPQVQSAVNAIYSNFQTIGLFVRAYFFQMDLMGGDAAGNPQLEADKVQYRNFSFDSSHGNISDYWESCFRGINKANFVIVNEDKINSINVDLLSDVKKAEYLGEARFLRALYYYLLVIRFGDVPLITEIPKTPEGFPISPKEDIYNLIISDLQAAVPGLYSKDQEEYELGRANKEAATALLGKVYLTLKQYDLALAEFNKIYGKYALEPNYFDNFKDETEHGVESIFEIEFDTALGTSALWNSSVSGAGQNESTLRGQEYGWNDWFNTYPDDDLLAEYEPGDSRYDDTFYTDGDIFEGDPAQRTIRTGVPPATVPATEIYISLARQSAWRKYQNYYKRLNENTNSSINFKYIRYADVLLMMAECENKRPGGDQDAAIGYINEVRQRPSVMLPELPLGQSPENVFNALVHERRVEFAGEQSRFNDLLRWDMAGTELSGQGFKTGIHELWPIPQREISNNDAITDDDQNPGY